MDPATGVALTVRSARDRAPGKDEGWRVKGRTLTGGAPSSERAERSSTSRFTDSRVRPKMDTAVPRKARAAATARAAPPDPSTTASAFDCTPATARASRNPSPSVDAPHEPSLPTKTGFPDRAA